MAALREPGSGCPWDLAQDFATIAPYTLEEAYEVADCIERGDFGRLPDELGDLLFQVVFHARLGAERGLFDFADVLASICSKMLRRHPHVFGEGRAADAAEVSRVWEDIKRDEQPEPRGLLDSVTLGLPALSRAAKLGKRAASVGFDWPGPAPVRAKIDEELAELDAAVLAGEPEAILSEVGDLLFSVVNLCRHLGIDPEAALRRANGRFSRRFGQVEAEVQARGGDFGRFSLEELDDFWNAAKEEEGKRNIQA